MQFDVKVHVPLSHAHTHLIELLNGFTDRFGSTMNVNSTVPCKMNKHIEGSVWESGVGQSAEVATVTT